MFLLCVIGYIVVSVLFGCRFAQNTPAYNNNYNDLQPQISGNNILWEAYCDSLGSDREIFYAKYSDGTSTVPEPAILVLLSASLTPPSRN